MNRWACAMVTALFLAVSPLASAASLSVGANQSKVIYLSGVNKVAVANPDIADVIVLSSNEVLLVGKNGGQTTLHVWSDVGRSTYTVEVASGDEGATAEIRTLVGSDGIQVSKVGKTIILEGKVNSQYQKGRAEKAAAAYGDKVVNLLEIVQPVQVKLEAVILEIDRSKIEKLGISWGNGTGANFAAGGFAIGQSQTNSILSSRPFGNLGTYADINGQVNALLQTGYAKILSRPNVITLSGDKASIMVGGQIPVPISNKDGQITIEWKDYGIKLGIEPEVNAEGLIRSQVKTEVSSLDWNSANSIKLGTDMEIPPLKVNKAETVLALSSGQTMALGGLISQNISKDVTKVPLLANLPILGNLFKSTSYTKGETELLILVTPTVVDPKEYLPAASKDMKDALKEDPWGGTNYEGHNQGASRRQH